MAGWACSESPGDYQAFIELLAEGKQRARVELFGFCLMPNHWHLVLRPKGDRDMAGYLSWVSNTHVKRYRSHYRRTSGHLYQGRYKSFPVGEDGYFLTLLRYVEAKPRRVRLVADARDWQWSSVGRDANLPAGLLDRWPVNRPRDWAALVNRRMGEADAQRVQDSLTRGRPLGGEAWTRQMAHRLGMQYTLNPRGRPPKKDDPRAK